MKSIIKKSYLNVCKVIYRVLPNYTIDNQLAKEVVHIKSMTDHIFRGYYDIDYFNKSEDKFLLHILPQKNENYGQITIGYYDFNKQIIIPVTTSNAWCWQQGARLRWFDSNCLMFNDCVKGKYVSRVVDTGSNNTEYVFERALYDVSIKKSFGLSLNFSRLQRLRPGYGYNSLNDVTKHEIASKSDGIYYVNLDSNTAELIISFNTLHLIVDPDLHGEDYVNHISISPDADKFIFFYIVCNDERKKNKVYLFCSDVKGKNPILLEDCVQTSHYTWLDDEHLLTTYLQQTDTGTNVGYRLYSLCGEKKTEYGEGILLLDGHPTFINDHSIITDTYPITKLANNQYLRKYDDDSRTLVDMGRFFQDVKYTGERRCDLHPSLHGDLISVDTSCNGLRSVVLLKQL